MPTKQQLDNVATVKARFEREITQLAIEDFAAQQRDVATLKRALKEKEEIVDALERAFDKMLTAGHVCEEGPLKLALKVSTKQTAVKWKEVFAKANGPKAVETAMQEAGMTEIRKVVVESTEPT